MQKVVFIDRDGVINVDLMGDYVKSPAEFRFEQGAVEALRLFCEAGYKIVIISNQAGIGDGVFPESALWDIQRHMIEELRKSGVQIHASHYCLHGKEEGCSCRKPETGLLEKAAAEMGFEFDRGRTWFIGDKSTDVEAGKRFGLKTFFVRTGHGVHDEVKLRGNLVPDAAADNLLGAARDILSRP